MQSLCDWLFFNVFGFHNLIKWLEVSFDDPIEAKCLSRL